ncbi:hypothetical protein ACF8GB_07885 [Pseudomonas sp. xss_4]|uniref:hypothetical protein n=1 Tax=Pseudomonas sp. xss_4 TaxID=3367216 RepID=UPI00370C2E82
MKSVAACFERENACYVTIEATKVDGFWPIHGYRIVTLEGTAFFPRDLTEIPSQTGLNWHREAFASVDIVTPPYYMIGLLSFHASSINSANGQLGKFECGDRMLREIYTPQAIAELIEGVWSKRTAFKPYYDQLVESSKAYCLGLYNVAIVGILPCIEGIVRRLGLASGIRVDSEVSINNLVKVFRRLQQKEVDSMMDGFDWFPASEINISLLNRFHERVQIFEGISNYLKMKLYLYTKNAPEHLTLNRHGISHGFFQGYATEANYLRLFNLLSALSFADIMVEGQGSLMPPGSSPESELLRARLSLCVAMSVAI